MSGLSAIHIIGIFSLALMESESCLEGLFLKKNYVVARLVEYEVNLNYLCQNDCLDGEVDRVLTGLYNYQKQKYSYDIPFANYSLLSYAASMKVYTRKGRKNVSKDTVILLDNQNCKCSSNLCYDSKSKALVHWNCLDSCEQKDISILYSGILEDWNLDVGLRFVKFNYNGSNVVIQLLKQKKLCNTIVWTTNLENIYLYKSDAILDHHQEDAWLYFNSSRLNYTFCEKDSKYLKGLERLFGSDKSTIIILLLVILLLLSIIKSCWGIFTNIFLLKKSHNLSCKELILRSFSQNLTHQKVFFHNKDNKSRLIIESGSQNLYANSVNEIYNEA